MQTKRRLLAFTIIELLVVIGIIAVLIGILIPVINQVRKAAYSADTRNTIKVIGNACDAYYTIHQSYPGIYSNTQITTGQTPANAGANVTMSENLILALCGGLSNATTYTAADVGKGPLTLGASPRRLQSSVEASPKYMSVTGSDLDPVITNWGSAIPEFIDRFPQAMPVLYLRARVGATGSVPAGAGSDANQYNPDHMQPYFSPYASTGISTTDFPADSGLSVSQGTQRYFTNLNLSSATTGLVPKNKDTYLLISPGEDRKYGTSDDICNFTF